MGSALFIPVGIVVARERISHPWQTYRWRPVGVFLTPLKSGNGANCAAMDKLYSIMLQR